MYIHVCVCVCVCGSHREAHNHVLVHELNDDGGRRLDHLAGITVDADVLDEDGLVPGGAQTLRDHTSPVATVVERQNAVWVCVHVRMGECVHVKNITLEDNAIAGCICT